MSQTLYGQLVERFKRRLLRLVLKKCNGNMARAGRLLGVERQEIQKLVKHFGIEPKSLKIRTPSP